MDFWPFSYDPWWLQVLIAPAWAVMLAAMAAILLLPWYWIGVFVVTLFRKDESNG